MQSLRRPESCIESQSQFHHTPTPTSVTSLPIIDSISPSSQTIKYSSLKWSAEDDDRLAKAVQLFGEKSWKDVSNFIGTKTNMQCRQRWLKCTRPGIRKGKWSEEEDELLASLMTGQYKNKGWRFIAEKISGRTSKQCRERWVHYLCPNVKKSAFTKEEDALLMSLYKIHNNHWAKISQKMPGRTENQIRYRVEYLTKVSLASRTPSNNKSCTASVSSAPQILSEPTVSHPQIKSETVSSLNVTHPSIQTHNLSSLSNYPTQFLSAKFMFEDITPRSSATSIESYISSDMYDFCESSGLLEVDETEDIDENCLNMLEEIFS